MKSMRSHHRKSSYYNNNCNLEGQSKQQQNAQLNLLYISCEDELFHEKQHLTYHNPIVNRYKKKKKQQQGWIQNSKLEQFAQKKQIQSKQIMKIQTNITQNIKNPELHATQVCVFKKSKAINLNNYIVFGCHDEEDIFIRKSYSPEKTKKKSMRMLFSKLVQTKNSMDMLNKFNKNNTWNNFHKTTKIPFKVQKQRQINSESVNLNKYYQKSLKKNNLSSPNQFFNQKKKKKLLLSFPILRNHMKVRI